MDKALADKTTTVIEEAERQIPEPGRGRRDPEILADLFAPEVVLPEQLLAGARRDSQASGEKALMLAVLEDGIRCFQEHLTNARSNPRLLSRQAEEWIRADDWDWPFSFNNVCENLCIDPEALRLALLTWKARKLAPADGAGTAAPSKVYRLHLRTKRSSGVR
ncbi:MAG TPA: hypothetical protein VNO26_02560 [Candidatus Limnocylindria bacterium]|nr:hypothetical protein [Candidatus Limnocylindria bacterium]